MDEKHTQDFPGLENVQSPPFLWRRQRLGISRLAASSVSDFVVWVKKNRIGFPRLGECAVSAILVLQKKHRNFPDCSIFSV